MKKALILAAVVAASFGCSKKTSEDPQPVLANGKPAQIQLRMEEDNSAAPATVSTSTSSKGSLITIGYNSFATKPSVGYYAGTLIPVVTFPVYSAQIASAGISEGCYNEFIQLFSKSVTIQASQDETAICDFVDSLVEVIEECSELTSDSKASAKQISDAYASVCN